MATSQMDTVIRHLRRAVLRQDTAPRTDGQLLTLFLNQKDESAFATLVRRHGPMVFGVCRRLVRNHHDAEDALQATFLVLARKASSVQPRERVANFLHGVALRTAMKAKTMTAKRRGREQQLMEVPEKEAGHQNQWADLQPLLDQELNGLPENYRLPILLCDLEGKTIKDAAQQLGWPQGSLAGRLARGRKLLAKRLSNRGVALSAGSLTAVVSQNIGSAGVPTSLISSTVKAATLIATGQALVAGVVPAKVATLLEGVMKSMMLTKLGKTALVGLVVVCLSGLGIGGFQALPAQETQTTVTTTTITTTITKQSRTDPRLEGKWVEIQNESEGNVRRIDLKDAIKNNVFSFVDGRFEQKSPSGEILSAGTYTTVIDPKGERNELDLIYTQEKGISLTKEKSTLYYIYRIEGDKLHWVSANRDQNVRPVTFSASAGSGTSLTVLQRVNPKATAKPSIDNLEEKITDQNDFRTPILPQFDPKKPHPICKEGPEDAQVLKSLPRRGINVPFVYEEFRDKIQIVKERLVDKIDPPRFFPLVGKAQLHHCQWKCTVYYEEVGESNYPFQFRTRRPRVQVVYIDKDHLHLVPPPTPEAAP